MIRLELANQLPTLVSLFYSEYEYTECIEEWVIPLLESQIHSKDHILVNRSVQNLIWMLKTLQSEQEILLSIVLGIIQDADKDVAIAGMSVLSNVIGHLTSELNSYFVYPVILASSSDSTARIREIAATSIPLLIQSLNDEKKIAKLVSSFQLLITDVNKAVVNACISELGLLYSLTEADSLLQLSVDLLESAPRETAINQILCILPHNNSSHLLSLYMHFCTEEDSQCHSARVFHRILKISPSYWAKLQGLFYHMLQEGSLDTRTTLISYIPEISEILGEKITADTLLPLYVKLATYSMHRIADFALALPLSSRPKLLPLLKIMQRTQENWRVRLSLSQQLETIVGLYPLGSLLSEIWPVLLRLLSDPILAVRTALAPALGTMILRLLEGNITEIPREFMDMAFSKHYKSRQLFALSCKYFLH